MEQQIEHSLVRQLASNSDPYRDPLARVRWAELSSDDWWLPPQALSLNGVPEFERLDARYRRRLSQYEFLGVIRAGLWFEGLFMQRLTRRLRRPVSLTRHIYLLHEVREEAGHSLMFLQLMERSGLPLPDLKGCCPPAAELLGRSLPVDGALFWLAVLMGEDVPDKLNRFVRRQPEGTVNPAIRDICTQHIIDEARHVAYARRMVESRLPGVGGLRRRLANPLLALVLRQLVDAVYLPAADLYELAGLSPGRRWRARARANPARLAFVEQCLAPTLRMLDGYGFPVSLA